MKTILRFLPLLIGAVCLTAASVALGDARTDAYSDTVQSHVHHHGGIHVDDDLDGNVTLRGDDVVITAHDDSEARITPNGDLYIRDKAVALDDVQRKLLRQYSLGIRNIQERGLQIARDALHMVGGMMGTLVADLMDGDDDRDRQIDRDMRDKAEPLKDEARALCKDVQSERKLQAAIVSALPAFQPYAVIDTKSDHDCHVDDNDIEV